MLKSKVKKAEEKAKQKTRGQPDQWNEATMRPRDPLLVEAAGENLGRPQETSSWRPTPPMIPTRRPRYPSPPESSLRIRTSSLQERNWSHHFTQWNELPQDLRILGLVVVALMVFAVGRQFVRLGDSTRRTIRRLVRRRLRRQEQGADRPAPGEHIPMINLPQVVGEDEAARERRTAATQADGPAIMEPAAAVSFRDLQARDPLA